MKLKLLIIATFVLLISNCKDDEERTVKENASFDRAKSLLQNSEYEQALKEIESISSRHKDYNEVLEMKLKLEHKIDSLQNEKNYELGKKLFDEKDYDKASSILGKVNSKHKNYKETRDMIAFTKEMIESGAVALILGNYIYGKDDLNVSGASSKEFQSILNNAKDKLTVLQTVVINYGVIAGHIKTCENYQKYEFKYLSSKEKNNLKSSFKNLVTQSRNKLKKEQLRDFPVLRKEYAKFMHEITKKNNNVETKAKGNRNSHLEFIGVAFANESNIDTFQKGLIDSGMLEKGIKFFRFKRISYKWYEYDNGFYYSYDTLADDVEVNEKTIAGVKK